MEQQGWTNPTRHDFDQTVLASMTVSTTPWVYNSLGRVPHVDAVQLPGFRLGRAGDVQRRATHQAGARGAARVRGVLPQVRRRAERQELLRAKRGFGVGPVGVEGGHLQS